MEKTPDELRNIPEIESPGSNPSDDFEERVTLAEAFLDGRRRRVFTGEYFGARNNLFNIELPDSPIPTEIAMGEHFFPEEGEGVTLKKE